MKTSSKIRYVFLGMLLMALLCVFITPVIAAQTTKQLNAYYNDIRIVIDGEAITPKDVNGDIVEPFVVNGSTYLPVRALATAFGKDVFWEQETNTVYIFTITYDEHTEDAESINK